MRTYTDKDELKNEIRQSFEKYISEFDTIPEALKDKRVPGVDRTPAEKKSRRFVFLDKKNFRFFLKLLHFP